MSIKFLIKLVVLTCVNGTIATPRAEQVQEFLFNTAITYNIPTDSIRILHNASPTVQKRRLLHQLYTDMGVETLCNEIKLISQSLEAEMETNRDSSIKAMISIAGMGLLHTALAAWNSLVRWDITSGPKYNRLLTIIEFAIFQAGKLYALSQQEVPVISGIDAVACALIEQSTITMNQEFIATLNKLLYKNIDQHQLQRIACAAKKLCNEYDNALCGITNLDAQQDYDLITNVAEIITENLNDPCNCCDLLRTLLHRSCTSR